MSIATSYANYAHTWWTPKRWITWVEETLGVSYFDPCPQDFSGHRSGLLEPWGAEFYCNHPGSRGSTKIWWNKFDEELMGGGRGIWCGFSVEQLRHMDPSPFHLDGWLIMPRDRIGFIWGGPDMVKVKGKVVARELPEHEGLPIYRAHGKEAKSPGNWTFFWSSVQPADPPQDCVIVRTRRDRTR